MPTPNVLESRIQERDQAIAAARAIAESDEFDPEDATFVDLQTRASELDKRIASLSSLLEQQSAADAFDGKIAKAAQTRQQRDEQPQTRESWGAAFVRSQEFTNYGGRGTTPKFYVEGDVETRALPMSLADMVGAGLRFPIYSTDVTAPPAPTPLLNNITNIQVSGNAVEIVTWAKVAGGAAVVPEEAAKPSAEWAPTVTPGVLDTIAVWTKLTRQLLEDMAAVRTKIDNELRREVLRETEEQAATALTAATLPTASGGGDLLAAIRVGIGTVQSEGYSPNAVLLNPADWADLDVAIMGDTLNGPRVNQTFWGLTPISSVAQPAGTAIVGDFRAGVEHYYRSAVALYASDSAFDGDFTKNLFTLLAEQRSKTSVVRPAALVECTAGV